MPQLVPTQQLSDLQQKILKHTNECTEKNESVSHISKELGALQPAVFRSIESLIEKGYLKKERDYTGREKLLSLTEKGAAVGFLLADIRQKFWHQEWEKLNESLEKKMNESNLHSPLQQLLSFLKEEPNNREPVINKALEYWLKNSLFQREKIDTHKLTMLILEALESNSALKQPKSIKKLIEKYGLDKNFIINVLEEKKKTIDLLLSELR